MYKKIKECHLSIGEKWCRSCLVTYPVSIRYNGGFTEYTYTNGKPTWMWIDRKRTLVKAKHYDGFEVVNPKVPKGFKLTGIGCGLQLNAMPPFATNYLEPLDENRVVTKSELKSILASMK